MSTSNPAKYIDQKGTGVAKPVRVQVQVCQYTASQDNDSRFVWIVLVGETVINAVEA